MGALRVNGHRDLPAVVAATVSYGDRGKLCVETITAALAAGCAKVIVVDNGMVPGQRQYVVAQTSHDPRVVVLQPRPNRGSCVGFQEAIRESSKLGFTFTWLLDDDNVVDPDALATLLAAYEETAASGRRIMFSLRTSDKWQASLARGVDRYPKPGSFMYFDLWRRRQPAPTSAPRAEGQVEPQQTHSVPYGPYGGMFGRSDELAALPSVPLGFWLYEDDTWFTAGAERIGYRLLLCAASVIRDADEKWANDVGIGPLRLLRAKDSVRRYFSFRNRAYVDFQRAREARQLAKFGLNMAAYMTILGVLGLFDRRLGPYARAVRAVWAGLIQPERWLAGS